MAQSRLPRPQPTAPGRGSPGCVTRVGAALLSDCRGWGRPEGSEGHLRGSPSTTALHVQSLSPEGQSAEGADPGMALPGGCSEGADSHPGSGPGCLGRVTERRGLHTYEVGCSRPWRGESSALTHTCGMNVSCPPNRAWGSLPCCGLASLPPPQAGEAQRL